MQEFNKITTTSNFIKELLLTTYLPVIRTIQAGDYVIKGRKYIYKCEIIEITKTGYIQPFNKVTLEPVATFKRIGEYTFGDKNGKLCQNFQSNKAGYDSLTHERLGLYLRSLRDMYGLNLMPLYNCFSNNPLDNYFIKTNSIIKTYENHNTKIYKVPIRFNTDYTVCIENIGKTTIAPAFIRNENLIYLQKTDFGNDIDITNRYISLHTSNMILSKSKSRFFNPFVIRFSNIPHTRTVQYNLNKDDYSYKQVEQTFNDMYSIVENENKNDSYFQTNKTRMYVTCSSSDSNAILLNNSNAYVKYAGNIEQFNDLNCIWYESKINPKSSEWYELSGESYIKSTDNYVDLSKTYYIRCAIQIGSYYEYTIDDSYCSLFDSIEDHLYMLIQVPKSFDSNIVVLEGNYTHIPNERIYQKYELNSYPNNFLDKLFTNNLKLMRANITTKVPFSDTLVQFLLWNAICGLDDINLDMDRLYALFSNLGNYADRTYYANYWYYRYRQLVYDFANISSSKFIDDNIGYVTSDIEEALEKGY